MSSHSAHQPSPTPLGLRENDDSTRSDNIAMNMLKINSLLNPDLSKAPRAGKKTTNGHAAPLTSALASASTTASSHNNPFFSNPFSAPPPTQTSTHTTSAMATTTNTANGYLPYELNENFAGMNAQQRHELARQHKIFQVLPPTGRAGDKIADTTSHVPYSSEKREFTEKTGKNSLDFYKYSFRIPNDPENKEYVVMWDYEIGYVRVTPFFKALKHGKTVPGRSISTNRGLTEVAPSVTGGALEAQGYWMPYECAKEICQTFCYKIRWALTPVFGPDIVRNCLKEDHPNFGKFKIRPATVRHALDALARRKAAAAAPLSLDTSGNDDNDPNDASVDEATATEGIGKMLPPRNARPKFKTGVFTTDTSDSSLPSSPAISPKTTYSSPGFTAINNPAQHQTAVPSSLDNSILASPWRPAAPRDDLEVYLASKTQPKKGKKAEAKQESKPARGRRANKKKRRHSSTPAAQLALPARAPSPTPSVASSPGPSEADEADLIVRPANRGYVSKRARLAAPNLTGGMRVTGEGRAPASYRNSPSQALARKARVLAEAGDRAGTAQYALEEVQVAHWLVGMRRMEETRDGGVLSLAKSVRDRAAAREEEEMGGMEEGG